MIIDIFFVLMAAFGFYFGFSFGLMRVVLSVVSVLLASLAAMKFTPTTADLIRDTFLVESPFLPFAAFLITLLIVLLLARIVAKLIEETVNNKRFDMMSKLIGALLMSLLFTFLYSGLVVFFGQANVVKLVFNRGAAVGRKADNIEIASLERQRTYKDLVGVDTAHAISMQIHSQQDTTIQFSSGTIPFKIDSLGKNYYKAYINLRTNPIQISSTDTIYLSSGKEMQLFANNREVCFCLSSLSVHTKADSLIFECGDEDLVSKSQTSFFYRYIEVIPRRGTHLMSSMLPFVQTFVDYMDIALKRIEKGEDKSDRPLNVFSPEDNNSPNGLLTPEPEPEPEIIIEDQTPPKADSIQVKIPSKQTAPVEVPSQINDPINDEEDINNYEG